MSTAASAPSTFVMPFQAPDSGQVGDCRNCFAIETTDATLLLRRGDHAQVCDAAGNVPRPNGVLVIEDQRLLRNALKEGFRHRGFDVWTAANGAEGVALYQQFGPQIDIVLSDVQMPVLDGPATLDALREMNPCVRCCFMTGDVRAVMRASLLRHDVLRVFEKPFQSVAALAQELWELATSPCHPVDEPDLGPAEAICPARSISESDRQEIPAGRFFAALVRWIACIATLLGKAQRTNGHILSRSVKTP